MQTSIAFCALGLEPLLRDEIKKMGLIPLEPQQGRVRFSATWEGLIRAQMGSRIAERMGWELFHGPCNDFDELYGAFESINWEDHFRPTDNIIIDHVRLNWSKLTAVPSVQSVAQKAIFSRLCQKWNVGRLELSGEVKKIRLYLDQDVLSIVLDTSGEPLHKRGYRKASGEAPLKETVASALVQFSGWRRKYALHDPFCGSGTILIEAGLYGRDQVPGVSRSYGFIQHPAFPHDLYQKLREEARNRVLASPAMALSGSDYDPRVIQIAQSNTDKARLQDYITYTRQDMNQALPSDKEPGFLICNPPYGERLETIDQAKAISREMRVLKQNFEGWNMGILTPLKDFPELFGAKPFKVRTIQNGSVSVFYYQFMGR